MFNIDDLIVFLEAAECGSFSEAGRNLHLSQPAISQKIDSLQKHFGIKLFVRFGRSMRLTEAGQVLRPLAKELIGFTHRLEETMVSLQGEVVGEMTIGCSTASGKYLLPGLIAAFRQHFPLVRINVQVTSRNSVLEKLAVGDVALGVSSKRIDQRDLEYRDFFTDDVSLIVPARHAWTELGCISPHDLLNEPIILREEVSGTREVMYDALRQRNIYPEMMNVAMELGNAEAIVMAVEEGLGVAFISHLAAARSIELGNVREIEVDGMQLQRSISLVRNKRIPPTRAQLEFWEFILTLEAQNKLMGKLVVAQSLTVG